MDISHFSFSCQRMLGLGLFPCFIRIFIRHQLFNEPWSLRSAFCQHSCWPCLAIAAGKICEHPLRLCAKNSGVSNKKKLKAWDHRILDMFKKVRHAYSYNNTTMADVTTLDLELWITQLNVYNLFRLIWRVKTGWGGRRSRSAPWWRCWTAAAGTTSTGWWGVSCSGCWLTPPPGPSVSSDFSRHVSWPVLPASGGTTSSGHC